VVEAQLRAVLEDARPGAVKTGMLGNESLVECVAGCLKRARVKNLVVDPVIRASSGKTLLSDAGVKVLRSKLLPLALVVTPNIPEAEALSGIRISKPDDRLKAARIIAKTGARSVLIKGGHAAGNADDFFYDRKRSLWLRSERLVGADPHGTGCVLAAAIAARLALGDDPASAAARAKAFVGASIIGGVRPGKGAECVEPMAALYESRERWDLFERVSRAAETLKEKRIGGLIPEVQSNIGVGLKNARRHEDVIAFPGRIVKMGRDIAILAAPKFGASRHVANVVLTAMRFDPSRRAVMNIKYTDALLAACKRLRFSIAAFDRADEPKNVKTREGSSLEWGTAKAILDHGEVPDIIYDLGGFGKEEMIRVLAEDIESLVEKVLRIHRAVGG
jgi:hydroxymethylpyrimidine/phosphomethylpyrimidine kinase